MIIRKVRFIVLSMVICLALAACSSSKASEQNTVSQPQIVSTNEIENEENNLDTDPIPDEETDLEKENANVGPEGAYYSIIISINPVVQLIVGEDNVVITVNFLNADSEFAYSEIADELVGQSITDATKQIVDKANELGYLKEGAACTITCNALWEPSEEIINQLNNIISSVQDTLTENNRNDAVVLMDASAAFPVLENAGIEIEETIKDEWGEKTDDTVYTAGSDSAFWPNLLVVVNEQTRVKQMVFLNDSANRAYAGVTTDVTGMTDTDAAKVYLTAAVDNGYIYEQFEFIGYDIPTNIWEKLVIFKSEYEAIEEGLIPIPESFYNTPSVAVLVDDNGVVMQLIYLNSAASSVYAGMESEVIGLSDNSALQKLLSVLYAGGYINNFDIPYDMMDYMVKFCNEEEAIANGWIDGQ